MGITPSTRDVLGAKREEGGASLAPTNEGPAVNGPRRAVFETGIEEDWASIANGDPAFWLKD